LHLRDEVLCVVQVTRERAGTRALVSRRFTNRQAGRAPSLSADANLVGAQNVEEREQGRSSERIEPDADARWSAARYMLAPHDFAWQVKRIPENGSDELEHDGEACREIERGR